MPIESEIKLRLAPEYLPEVSEHPAVIRHRHRGPIRAHLHSIYFDTSDLALLGQGVGLRVRRSGQHWVQTLKSGGAGEAGLHRRQEWESEVEGGVPILERLAAEAKVGVLAEADLAARLIPVFETDFWRTSWVLQIRDGSAIELSADEGHIGSNGRSALLSELELELKQGEEKELYKVALWLAEIFPVAVEHASKAERGYRLYTQQFSPLTAPGPAPAAAATVCQRLSYWLARLQYGERLLLERHEAQGQSHLQAAAEGLHGRMLGAGWEAEPSLQEDLAWLVRELRENQGFAEKAVAAPRYSRLLLRLGEHLAELAASPQG